MFLRRGGGLKRSSRENVLAVAPPGSCGLLRLNIDGFLIPNRPKIDRCCAGVVAVDDALHGGNCCAPAPVVVPPAVVAVVNDVKCSCSRRDG